MRGLTGDGGLGIIQTAREASVIREAATLAGAQGERRIFWTSDWDLRNIKGFHRQTIGFGGDRTGCKGGISCEDRNCVRLKLVGSVFPMKVGDRREGRGCH